MMIDQGDGMSPLVIGLGGVGCDLVASLEPLTYDTLLLDTDRRVERKYPDLNVITLGKDLMSGEGCGGNMNLGKACFKTGMEDFLSIIMKHRPVITVSHPGGGTGTPGAVEISHVLEKFKLPHYNFLVCRKGLSTGGLDPFGMGEFLLKGPLRPGSLISLDSEIGPPLIEDEHRLARALHVLASSCSGSARAVLPVSSWEQLASSEGPVGSYLIEFDTGGALTVPMPVFDREHPVVLSLSVPERISNEELMETIGRILPDGSRRAVGIIISNQETLISAVILHPGGSLQPAGPRPAYQPPPGLMEVLKAEDTPLGPDETLIISEQ